MRKLIVVVALASLLALAATAIAATREVKVGDDYFVRSSGVPTVTVTRNTTVKWVWRGKRKHNVHATSGPVKFASTVKKTGIYSKKMTRRGTYRIICDVHGSSDQSMKLVVK